MAEQHGSSGGGKLEMAENDQVQVQILTKFGESWYVLDRPKLPYQVILCS